MTSFDSSVPIVNQPFLYINDMKITNNVATPNTKLDVAAGICRDSSNSFDINLGNYLGMLPYGSANASTTINAAVNGVNGLDTGSLGATKIYYVYVVADAVNGNATGCMVSLAAPSVGPLIPFGYNLYRHIGYAFTDGSSHFLKAYIAGNNNARVFMYDAPRATAVTAGAATSYTAVSLANLVPPVEDLPVWMAYAFTPGAASRVLNLTPGNGTGDAVTVTGQVTSVVISANALVLSKVTSAVPEIDYKVSNSGDAVALNVAGFQFYI